MPSALLAVTLAVLGSAGPAVTGTGDGRPVLSGRVTQVFDGDSIEVRLTNGLIQVRLHGIDAPEKNQSGADEARSALARLISGREIELVPVEQDTYDRLVAGVLAGDTDVNAAMLGGGHAWAYRRYLGDLAGDRDYCQLEDEARRGKRGLWGQPAAQWIAPWEYRASGRGQRESFTDFSGETAERCRAAIPARPAGHRDAGRKPGCLIKGNINAEGERIYHRPGDASYRDTRVNASRGERWFCTEEEARAAGWRAAR
jgi:endonuclease YncB( thermonuclease family)